MKRTHTIVASIVAGVALAVAAATFAQPFGGMGYGGYGYGPGMGMGMGMGTGPGHGPMGGFDPSVMADYRLADLKAQLKITTAQESAWESFAAQAKAQGASMQALRIQMQQQAGSAPERMAQHSAAMQQRAAGMATMTAAFDALYSVLTPEQKAIVDQNYRTMGPRGRGFGPRAG